MTLIQAKDLFRRFNMLFACFNKCSAPEINTCCLSGLEFPCIVQIFACVFAEYKIKASISSQGRQVYTFTRKFSRRRQINVLVLSLHLITLFWYIFKGFLSDSQHFFTSHNRLEFRSSSQSVFIRKKNGAQNVTSDLS